MSKLNNMRVIEIPKFRAISSGIKTLEELFGEGDSFSVWVNHHRQLLKDHIYEPQDFLWHENDDIIEFPGGMFLVATGDENDDDDFA